MTLTTRRLLLIAGGSGSFIPTNPPTTLITARPYAGATQIPDPRGIYYNGWGYFSFVDGTTGDVGVVPWDYATQTPSTPVILHSALSSPADTHNAPALRIRPSDHKLLAVYSPHNGSPIRRRISTTSLDTDPDLSDGFATAGNIRTGSQFTYPILMQRLNETNDPWYAWYRRGSGAGGQLAYSKSTNDGSTWSNGADVWGPGPNYWKIVTDGQYRIDFIVTDGNPAEAASPIGHFYADATGYHDSTGADIGDPPFSFSDFTEVYDSSDGPAWPTDALWDGTSVRFVYNIDNGSATDSEYRFAKLTAGTWSTSTILASAGQGVTDPAPVAALAQDGTTVYLTRIVSSLQEVWRYASADDGATWDTGTPAGVSASERHLYPFRIYDAPPGELDMAWNFGDYTGAESGFELGTVAVAA